MKFHPPVRLFDRRKPKLLVKSVGIARGQHPPAQSLQIRMPYNALHQPSGEPTAAMRRKNENVRQIRERCPVRNNAGKSNLLSAVVNAEADGILNGPPH